MSAVVIVGAQWGDEGKGKVVDLYTEQANVVGRYAGGANAGHTLFVGDGNDKVVMRLVPSGVLRPGVKCVLGQGMVIDPASLLGELDELAKRGRDAAADMIVSERAHIIFSYHKLVDGLRESGAKPGEAIGTTRRGIGPAYEDKAGRRGITMGDLRDPARVRARVAKALDAWAPTIKALGGEVPSLDEVLAPVLEAAPRVIALLGDASSTIDQAIKRGENVLLEGAQGTLLDVDHGTYPFVTSSSAVAGGACTGAGVGPSRISQVVGITKAYTTRVGAGPFPTELLDETGEQIRQVGGEFGSVTGRPRRTGWLDLPGLRYAARVNGLDALALTKLDVLTGLDTLQLCVGYKTPAGETEDFPIEYVDDGAPITPIYETVRGWTASIAGARKLSDLPPEALAYVQMIEKRVGVPLCLVSVGPRRNETIVLSTPFATRRA